MGKYSIPVVLLARLAIDKSVQGQGFGSALLKDALKRAAFNISKDAGVRAVLIHAKNTKVRDWYKKQAGFIESPTDSLHLFLLIQEIEKNLKSFTHCKRQLVKRHLYGLTDTVELPF